MYMTIYQIGVFIARSSISFVRFRALYLLTSLQCANLVFLLAHAVFDFIPSVYIVFVVIFWEGILGGLAYVNTFAEMTETVSIEDREFCLGAVSASDSAGVCIASFSSIATETLVCDYQIRHGRDYCRRL